MADEIGIHDDGVLTAVRGTIFMRRPRPSLPPHCSSSSPSRRRPWRGRRHVDEPRPHVERQPAEFALDGGDATTLSTWLKAAFRTQYAQTTGTVTFNSVQGDKARSRPSTTRSI